MTREELEQYQQRCNGKPIWTRASMQPIPQSYDEKTNSIGVRIASERDVKVWDWERFDVVTENLIIRGYQLPEGKTQVPAVDSHDRGTVQRLLGSIRDFAVEPHPQYGEMLVGRWYFSSTPEGESAKRNAMDGHLTDLSAGYEQVESYWIPEGQSKLIAGRTWQGPRRVTPGWILTETSPVVIGADSITTTRAQHISLDVEALKKDLDEAIAKVERIANPPTTTITRGGVTMDPNDKTTLTEAERTAVREEETKRIQGITDWKQRVAGKVENVDELASAAYRSGMSVDQFKGQLAEKLAATGQPLVSPALGLSNKEKSEYSISRAIAYQCQQRGIPEFVNMKIDATREIEYSNEITKRTGEPPKGLYVPYEMQPGRMAQRDQTVGTATAGGNLVGTNLMPSEYIDLPRNVMLADKIGVRRWPGLVGNVAIPRLTAAGTAEWVPESTAASETAVVIGQLTLTPKTVTAWYDYSRKLWLQSTPGIDGIINDDGNKILLLAIDKAIFHGTGTNQPTGIALTSGVGDVVAAGLDRAIAIEFWTDVAVGNSLSEGSAFITDPVTYGLLMGREMAAGYPMYLLQDGKLISMAPAFHSNQINAGYIFYGDGSTVILGEWGTLDVLVDPYTASTKGDVRVVFFKSVDVGVRLPSAWSVADDAS